MENLKELCLWLLYDLRSSAIFFFFLNLSLTSSFIFSEKHQVFDSSFSSSNVWIFLTDLGTYLEFSHSADEVFVTAILEKLECFLGLVLFVKLLLLWFIEI